MLPPRCAGADVEELPKVTWSRTRGRSEPARTPAGSPAYAAGLDRAVDLRQMAGERLRSYDDVAAILQRHKPGDRMMVVYAGLIGLAGWQFAGNPHRAESRQLDPARARRIGASGKEIAVADEFAHESVRRPVVHIEWGADLLELAVAEYGDPVGHRHRFGLIMGDIDHGDADLAMDAFELDLHLLAQILVERAKRLVEQQHIWIEDQSARKGDALLLASG